MDKEFLKKWVEALRSGKYKQGQNCLRKGDTYCCLGVACDVINPDDWEFDRGAWTWNKGYLFMPSRFGMTHGFQTSLSKMNDEEGKNFDEIAMFIETHLSQSASPCETPSSSQSTSS